MTALARAALAMHRRRKGIDTPFTTQQRKGLAYRSIFDVRTVTPVVSSCRVGIAQDPTAATGTITLPDPGMTSVPKRRLSDADLDKFNEHANWLADNLSARARATLVDEFAMELKSNCSVPNEYCVGVAADRRALAILGRLELIHANCTFGSWRHYFLTPLGAEVRRAVMESDA